MKYMTPFSSCRSTFSAFKLPLLAWLFFAIVSCSPADSPQASEKPIVLAKDGKTSYQIVRPEHASAVDDYAIAQLVKYLQGITGATFEVIAPGQAAAGQPAIYVGMSEPARSRLGGDPLSKLRRQEHVSRTVGQDVFLYGEGLHGNFYAVMDFLENSLGWRWFSAFTNPVLPNRPDVTLDPFSRTSQPSFLYREVALRWRPDFYYQQEINGGFERRLKLFDKKDRGPIVSDMPSELSVHTLFSYIPPVPGDQDAKVLECIERSNYFQTNPDFFSANEKGKRVPNMQLDFSNRALRDELTRNILKHIEQRGEDNVIVLDAEDTPGPFSYSPGSIAFEKKYQSPAGPIIDYLLELCSLLKKEHPGVKVKTIAYRRNQTQKPPVLPPGEKLPDNLIVNFAPIEDSLFADWTHPDENIQETYRDLQGWSKITAEGNLWAWVYPNPYGSAAVLPIGNIDRLITNIRMAYRAGVRGLFVDHNGFNSRSNFSELQSYLIYKLMQDVNVDTNAVIREFTDNFYGAAGPLIRKYLAELESARKEMKELPKGVSYTSGQRFDHGTFPYLTADNIHRWQVQFDEMERRAANQPRALDNVRIARRELDYATLCWWFDLKKAFPEYFADHTVFLRRAEAANAIKPENEDTKPSPLAPALLKDFLTVIESGGKEKPLPAELAGLPEDQVRTFLPVNHIAAKRRKEGRKLDPDAARGYATIVDHAQVPLDAGFYQITKGGPTKGVHGPRIKLEGKDISPGKYHLYKLGRTEITPDCMIWIGRSWQTHIKLGEQLYEPGADNLWDAFISIKFEGPAFGDPGKENEALVDRIIMVRVNKSQF